MRHIVLLATLLAVESCNFVKPSIRDVEIIERLMAQDKCVDDLKGWSRTYAYATRGNPWPNTDLIDVEFVRPGWDGATPGRNIVGSSLPTKLDDRDIQSAKATYRRSTRELDLWACGRNTSGSVRHLPKF